jgi:integrase
MRGRRGHGEGSVHKRVDGRWVGVVDLGWHGGKRRRKYVYAATRREAQDKVQRVHEERRRTGSVADDRITLAMFAREWLTATEHTVRASTYARYETNMRLHVLPAIGKRKLNRLAAADLQRLYAGLLRGGLSARSVLHIHRMLHRALRQAVRWGYVGRNVVELVDPPRVARRSISVLTPDQVGVFLDGTRQHRLGALFITAVTTGMRQGELFALRWRDVDLDRGLVRVTGTLLRSPKGGWQIGEPKTAGSIREVLLPALTAEALREHQASQQEQRSRASTDWHNHGFVFTNDRGGPLSAHNLLPRDFYPLLEQLELPRIRFHDLRHTAATFLLSEGVHPKIVSEMLGHTDIGITLNLYSHVIPGLQAHAAGTFDRVFGESAASVRPARGPYDESAPSAAPLAVNLAVKPRSRKVKAQVSPRSSGDRATVS